MPLIGHRLGSPLTGACGKPRRQFLPQRKTLEDDSGVVIYRVHQKRRAVTIAWSTTVPQALDGIVTATISPPIFIYSRPAASVSRSVERE
jgi:hypothetical protein